MTYQEMTISHPLYGEQKFIVRKNETSSDVFAADPANTDYQQYLAWLAEGNTPEPWEATNGPV